VIPATPPLIGRLNLIFAVRTEEMMLFDKARIFLTPAFDAMLPPF
jgi:hypothetical protein